MSYLHLSNLVKSYQTQNAVDGVSFDVPRGAFTALLGPSGCGKSTTLRLIAGLETASSGTIRIDGTEVTHLPPSQRGLAMVFQNYALFPHLTVAQNILFGLEVRKVPRKERETRLSRAAELLGLTPYLSRKPSQLSGGQQQRVALGRAIVAEASICLMDEPLSNLDAKLRQEMRREIRALQQRLGLTLIYVTHDQVEAMTMADEIILMKEGRIEQMGRPETLYQQPASTFVAGFIGTPPMNILPGETLGRPADHAVGVRSEHVMLGEGAFRAIVTSVEYLGADTLVGVDIVGHRPHPLILRVTGQISLAVGATVSLGWRAEHEHLFDAQSGLRIAN